MRSLYVLKGTTVSYPLTLPQIKSQLRIAHDEFDALVMSLHFPAAISWAEGETHRAIALANYLWVASDFPLLRDARIMLPMGRTQSVQRITYATVGGGNTTLTGPSAADSSVSPVVPAGSDYTEDLGAPFGGVLVPPLTGWPSNVDLSATTPVRVAFRAGWAADDVPADIKIALMWYIQEALDATGGADLPSNANFELKNTMLSGWKLR